MNGANRWLVALTGCGLALAGAAFVPAGARSASPTMRSHTGPIAAVNPNHSNNWSGYNQGRIERGTSFHSVAGDWIVPTASPHKQAESEFSSSWVGIGGGCVDAGCSQTDNTLIQAGTEQDVIFDPTTGTSTQYSAWYELIPDAATTVALPVKPGDHFHVDIHENGSGSNNWTITLSNLTQAKSFTKTVSYNSTYATAEWIEEAPVVVSPYPPAAGFGPLPNLTTVQFDLATANGAGVGLKPSEAVQMVDFLGNPTATPSAPDAQADGFNDCTYAKTCSAPTTSLAKAPLATSSSRPRRTTSRRR